jgi:2-hydroxychromene-2-carboxylate isomerase
MPAIERRTGVKFEYVPVLLGGIYKATNNMSPAQSLRGIKNKPEYQALETQRFIRRRNITKFRQNPFFPVNTPMLMRGAVITCGKNPRRWTTSRFSAARLSHQASILKG